MAECSPMPMLTRTLLAGNCRSGIVAGSPMCIYAAI
jgi:hypothetical protein